MPLSFYSFFCNNICNIRIEFEKNSDEYYNASHNYCMLGLGQH